MRIFDVFQTFNEAESQLKKLTKKHEDVRFVLVIEDGLFSIYFKD